MSREDFRRVLKKLGLDPSGLEGWLSQAFRATDDGRLRWEQVAQPPCLPRLKQHRVGR